MLSSPRSPDHADLTLVLLRTVEPDAPAVRAPTARSHVLEPHLGSPRRARVLLRRACLDWALGNAYDDAALVVTELVTNAVRHAGTPCRLTITLDGDGLRIAVRDRGPLRPGPPRRHAGAAPGSASSRASLTAGESSRTPTARPSGPGSPRGRCTERLARCTKQ